MKKAFSEQILLAFNWPKNCFSYTIVFMVDSNPIILTGTKEHFAIGFRKLVCLCAMLSFPFCNFLFSK